MIIELSSNQKKQSEVRFVNDSVLSNNLSLFGAWVQAMFTKKHRQHFPCSLYSKFKKRVVAYPSIRVVGCSNMLREVGMTSTSCNTLSQRTKRIIKRVTMLFSLQCSSGARQV